LTTSVYRVYTVYKQYIQLANGVIPPLTGGGGVDLDIVISNSSLRPIYLQISDQIKRQILSGKLQDEEMLPSIRVLARELQISVITVRNAYEELEREGLVESAMGKGFFVATKNKELIREKKISLIEEKLAEVIEECRLLGIEEDEFIEMARLLYG
jgi:GntR family transcriptional regulator